MISSGPGCWRQVAWLHVRGIYLNMWNCSRWRIQSELHCRASPEAFHWRRGWWQIVLGGRFFREGEMFTLRLKNKFFVAFKFTFRQSLFKSLTVLQLYSLVGHKPLFQCLLVLMNHRSKKQNVEQNVSKNKQEVELNSRNKSRNIC